MACFLVWVFLPWLGTDYLGWFYSQYTALYSFANLFPRVFMLWANIGYSFHCLTTLALWWVSMVYGIFVFRFDLFDLLVGLAFHFSWIAFYVNEFCAFFLLDMLRWVTLFNFILTRSIWVPFTWSEEQAGTSSPSQKFFFSGVAWEETGVRFIFSCTYTRSRTNAWFSINCWFDLLCFRIFWWISCRNEILHRFYFIG